MDKLTQLKTELDEAKAAMDQAKAIYDESCQNYMVKFNAHYWELINAKQEKAA